MEELLRDVTKRLNVIIRLVMDEQIRVGRVKKGDLLLLLTSCGLSTGDIASIVGGRTKDIASALRKARGGARLNERRRPTKT